VAATSDNTIDLLRQVPLFSTLADDELARVAEVTTTDRFEPEQIVFHEGDSSNSCYVIRSGHAAALREHVDGRAITLARFGPGDIFGELAMLDNERRSATIKALDELEVTVILGPDMRRLLGEHPALSVKLIVALGRRLRETNERVTDLSFQTVQSRVAKVLLQLVEAARSEGAPEHDVLITSTQAELARLAGSSRESASRFLAVLERAGIITQGRGRLSVHNPEALEGYVY
jgi:CRP/FNR family transcriptional regulator